MFPVLHWLRLRWNTRRRALLSRLLTMGLAVSLAGGLAACQVFPTPAHLAPPRNPPTPGVFFPTIVALTAIPTPVPTATGTRATWGTGTTGTTPCPVVTATPTPTPTTPPSIGPEVGTGVGTRTVPHA